jgi:hypothetical protein
MADAKVGGGLFPALSGRGGVRIKYNFGQKPMTHKPPSEQYITVVAARNIGNNQVQ